MDEGESESALFSLDRDQGTGTMNDFSSVTRRAQPPSLLQVLQS